MSTQTDTSKMLEKKNKLQKPNGMFVLIPGDDHGGG